MLLAALARLANSVDWRLDVDPLCVLVLVDDRQSAEAKDVVASEFWSPDRSLCCRDPGCMRSVAVLIQHQLGPHASVDDLKRELRSPAWLQRFRGLSRDIDGFCSDVENRHKRSREIGGAGSMVSNEQIATVDVLHEIRWANKASDLLRIDGLSFHGRRRFWR